MKRFYSLLISAVFALTACSSMDVSDSEAVQENFPKDFVNAVYIDLHPELVSLQIQDYISKYNKALDLSKEVISQDSAIFADTANLHQIFVNPKYAGYTEELWQETFEVMVFDSVIYETKLDTVAFKIDDLVNSSVLSVYNIDSIGYNLTGDTVIYVSGTSDKEGTIPVAYEIDPSIYSINAKGTQTDTVKIDSATVSVEQAGSLTKNQMKALLKFNFNDTTDDLAALANIPLDTFALTYQYVVYGKAHGFAYRPCSSEELNNPIKTESYPATKFYCADPEGIIREIIE